MPTASPSGSGFSQSGNNRTRGDSLLELASYLNLEESVDAAVRAGRAWEAAVREYNTTLWKFNRVVVDVTFDDLVTTGEYDLPTDFKRQERAILLDANGKEAIPLAFFPYEDKVLYAPDETSPGPQPRLYTAFNIFSAGKIRYWPVPFGALQYPKARHSYFHEIIVPKGDDDRLNAPLEVDEGIFQLALAKFVHAMRGSNAARTEYVLAGSIRALLEKTYRGWIDSRG